MRRRNVTAVLILVLASLVLVLPGSGQADGIVHGDEPFADPACWATPCESGGYSLLDLVNGTYDWGDPPDGVAAVLRDVAQSSGIIPVPQMVPQLRTLTLSAQAVEMGWRLAANTGQSAWLHLNGAGLGTFDDNGDVSIGPLQWVWSPDGINDFHEPGWYLYSARGQANTARSNCLQASNGSCVEAPEVGWGRASEEAYFQAMMKIHTGVLVPRACSIASNGVEVCRFLRYIPASAFWDNVTMDQPLQPYTGQPGFCTGYADPTNGAGTNFDPYDCGSGPGPNPDPGTTRPKIDNQDDPTRNDFNCRLKPRSYDCPSSGSTGGSGGPKPKTRVPVIFLPGIQGSELTCYGIPFWPNALLWTSDSDDWMRALKLNDNGTETTCPSLTGGSHPLEAPDVIRSVLLGAFDIYDTTLQAFENAGYTEGVDLFVHPFDWRKTALANSEGLVEQIQSVAALSPTGKVDILAHSQGGLVTRIALTRSEVIGHVRRVVTLGTPVLGAGKLLGVMLANDPCLREMHGVCLLNKKTVSEVVRTFPGAYDLIPSASYTAAVRPPLRVNGQPVTEGGYESLAAQAANQSLAQQAFRLHARYDSVVPADPSVQWVRIAGIGKQTIGSIDLETASGKQWFSVFWDADGDGTVPAGSASLYAPGRFDGRAGFPSLYAYGTDHMGLATTPCVLLYVTDWFGGADSPRGCVAASPPPRPLRMARSQAVGAGDAVELAVDGPVTGDVHDAAGNILGPRADNSLSLDLPGSNYQALGDSQSFIADAGDYTAALTATGNDTVRVRIVRWATDGTQDEQAVFLVPTVAAGTSISLAYGSTPLADLRLNVGGNQIAPLAVTSGTAASDEIPPTAYGDATTGPRLLTSTVTLQADDDSSGVASILYTVNGGAQMTYSGPFTVPVLAHITTQAVDRAGNLSAPVTFVADDAPNTARFAAALGHTDTLRFLAPKGDEDWFRFTAVGKKTTVEAKGLLATDTVQLRNAAGALIASRGSSGDLSWKLPAGSYTLRIAGNRAGLLQLLPYVLALRD